MSTSGGNLTKERFLHTLAVSLGNGVLCICIHAIEDPLEPSVWFPWFVLGIGIVIGAVFRSFYTPGFIRTFGSVVLASVVWLLTNVLLGKFWLSGLHPWLPLYWLSCWLGAGLALDTAGRPFFLTPVLVSFMSMMACMAFIVQDGHPSSCVYAHVCLYTCAGMMMRRQEVPLWLGFLIPGMEVLRGILAGLLTADHWWPLIHFLYPLVSLCAFFCRLVDMAGTLPAKCRDCGHSSIVPVPEWTFPGKTVVT